MHCAGLIALEFIFQMPSSRRHDILSDGNGVFHASDMDWSTFHRDGEFLGNFTQFLSVWVNDFGLTFYF